MKFEFSADIKGVPAAQVRCCIDCNAEELAIMLADPVYQALGAKLVNEISFAPKQEQSQNHQRRSNLRKAQTNHNF